MSFEGTPQAMENDPEVARLVAEVGFEQFRLYHLFDRLGSFQAVGESVHSAPNTVRDHMLKLSKLFESMTGRPLLIQGAKGGYSLTLQGSHIGGRYESLSTWLGDMLDEHKGERRVYDVPCTTAALGLFVAIQRELEKMSSKSQDFSLRLRASKTADLQLYDGQSTGFPFALGSILLNDIGEKGPTIVHRPPLKIHVAKDDPLFLLADPGLGLPTVELDLLEHVMSEGVTIVMPEGGVVWKYLQELYPDWHIGWPQRLMPVPHLEYALKVLGERAVPRAAIVVHSIDDLGAAIDGLSIHRLRDRNNMGHRAITGLIVDPTANADAEHSRIIVAAAKAAFKNQNRTEN